MKSIEITAIVADQIIRVEFNDMSSATIYVRDMMTGQTGSVECTVKQAGAIMNLIIAGDEGLEYLYDTHQLEKLMDKLQAQTEDGDPLALRCIP